MSTITVAPLLKNEALAAAELFFETVHRSNGGDYSPDQLDAWAPSGLDHQRVIADKLTAQYTLAAKASDALVGFASLADPDYLDMLFVHPAWQRHGIARQLVAHLELHAQHCGAAIIRTHASLTARPFFEASGYRFVSENTVMRNEIELKNLLMEKELPPRS